LLSRAPTSPNDVSRAIAAPPERLQYALRWRTMASCPPAAGRKRIAQPLGGSSVLALDVWVHAFDLATGMLANLLDHFRNGLGAFGYFAALSS